MAANQIASLISKIDLTNTKLDTLHDDTQLILDDTYPIKTDVAAIATTSDTLVTQIQSLQNSVESLASKLTEASMFNIIDLHYGATSIALDNQIENGRKKTGIIFESATRPGLIVTFASAGTYERLFNTDIPYCLQQEIYFSTKFRYLFEANSDTTIKTGLTSRGSSVESIYVQFELLNPSISNKAHTSKIVATVGTNTTTISYSTWQDPLDGSGDSGLYLADLFLEHAWITLIFKCLPFEWYDIYLGYKGDEYFLYRVELVSIDTDINNQPGHPAVPFYDVSFSQTAAGPTGSIMLSGWNVRSNFKINELIWKPHTFSMAVSVPATTTETAMVFWSNTVGMRLFPTTFWINADGGLWHFELYLDTTQNLTLTDAGTETIVNNMVIRENPTFTGGTLILHARCKDLEPINLENILNPFMLGHFPNETAISMAIRIHNNTTATRSGDVGLNWKEF